LEVRRVVLHNIVLAKPHFCETLNANRGKVWHIKFPVPMFSSLQVLPRSFLKLEILPMLSSSFLPGLVLALVSFQYTSAAPTGTASVAQPNSLLGYSPDSTVINQDTDDFPYELVPGQTDSANIGAYLDFNNVKTDPQPIRGTKGGTDPGPRTGGYDKLNPDQVAPPGTDHGDVDNAQWPMGLSHRKLGLDRAGWSRQQNEDNIPAATAMAGVDMRLEEGAYRELHWWVFAFVISILVRNIKWRLACSSARFLSATRTEISRKWNRVSFFLFRSCY